MIPFDYNKLEFREIKLKSVSGVQDGRMTYLDEARSTNEKEVFVREAIPSHVVRAFTRTAPKIVGGKKKVEKELRSFLKPIKTAAIYYDGKCVALERHPLGNLAGETLNGGRWISKTENILETFVKPQIAKVGGKWYFDGTFIYMLQETNPEKWEPVSLDGRFRQVRACAIKLVTLRLFENHSMEERICLAYVAKNGKYAVSPPIWASLNAIGRKIDDASHDDVEDDFVTYRGDVKRDHLDRINKSLCINLSFILRAGKELADVFGYDIVEPLNLPDLMLRLKTVNLPNVHHAVKQTFDSGTDFTTMVAWLLGLAHRSQTLDSFIVIRSLLKHLTGKGIYWKNALEEKEIFRKGSNLDSIRLTSIKELEKRMEAERKERSVDIQPMIAENAAPVEMH